MKGVTDIISAIHNLNIAKAHLESYCREYPGTKGASLSAAYIKKIDWIFKDIITYPQFPKSVVDGIKLEINSDAFTVPAIVDKIARLTPEQREAVEAVIDSVASGSSLTVEMSLNKI